MMPLDQRRPSARGPEFRSYLEAMVKSSKGLHDAAERMGYASPTTVTHHMRRFGIKSPDHWYTRPPPNTPEFRAYFEDIVSTSQSMTEAVKRLGYTRPQSVRYNLKRFGIEVPAHWYSHRDMRPSTKDPGFRTYFERIIGESADVNDAMKKLGCGGPTSVYYHMRKMGLKAPIHWYGHPSARSSEFAPYFENVVRTSKTVGEAVRRLGYANASMIWHHINRLGIESPSEWRLKPGVSTQRKSLVPEAILKEKHDKSWVAALHQGEGCLTARYVMKSDETALALVVGMTDSAPVFRFCDLCGVGRPGRAVPRPRPYKPMWIGAISGLRSYRVVREILPFLIGQKLEEAKRALEFFSPDGYRKGKHSAYDIWPDNGFPLRKRGMARHAQSLIARIEELDMELKESSDGSMSLKLDRTCLRIADVLIDSSPHGIGLVEIMDRSGASWTAAIHHLRHLEGSTLVARERIHQKRGPTVLYAATPRLVEWRELGWLPDFSSGPSNRISSGPRESET